MYRMDTVLSLILLVFEMLKIPKTKVEAHFLKKLDFVTNKCLAQDAFRKCPRSTENLSKYTASQLSQDSYVHKFSYYRIYSTKLSQ